MYSRGCRRFTTPCSVAVACMVSQSRSTWSESFKSVVLKALRSRMRTGSWNVLAEDARFRAKAGSAWNIRMETSRMKHKSAIMRLIALTLFCRGYHNTLAICKSKYYKFSIFVSVILYATNKAIPVFPIFSVLTIFAISSDTIAIGT